MSKMLFDDHPILLLPELATILNSDREAYVLQQVHYWIQHNAKTRTNHHDGHYWTYNTVQQWQEAFPWLSYETVKRILKSLRDKKLLITGNYNRLQIDKTLWYRIDYDVLEALKANSPLGQNDPFDGSKCSNGRVKMNEPLPETSTETFSETSKPFKSPKSRGTEENEVDKRRRYAASLIQEGVYDLGDSVNQSRLFSLIETWQGDKYKSKRRKAKAWLKELGEKGYSIDEAFAEVTKKITGSVSLVSDAESYRPAWKDDF